MNNFSENKPLHLVKSGKSGPIPSECIDILRNKLDELVLIEIIDKVGPCCTLLKFLSINFG